MRGYDGRVQPDFARTRPHRRPAVAARAQAPLPAAPAAGPLPPRPPAACPRPRLGRPAEFAAFARHIVENIMFNGAILRLDGAIRMGAK